MREVEIEREKERAKESGIDRKGREDERQRE